MSLFIIIPHVYAMERSKTIEIETNNNALYTSIIEQLKAMLPKKKQYCAEDLRKMPNFQLKILVNDLLKRHTNRTYKIIINKDQITQQEALEATDSALILNELQDEAKKIKDLGNVERRKGIFQVLMGTFILGFSQTKYCPNFNIGFLSIDNFLTNWGLPFLSVELLRNGFCNFFNGTKNSRTSEKKINKNNRRILQNKIARNETILRMLNKSTPYSEKEILVSAISPAITMLACSAYTLI